MNQISNPAGLRVLESLIQIIENKSEIKKILTEIRGARDEANEKIAVVGKIKDIDALRDQAAAYVAETAEVLGEAKTKAKRILGKAGKDASAEKARQKRADGIFAAAEAREKNLDSRESSVNAREQELQQYMDQTQELQAEASALKTRAEEMITEADARLARFQQLASQLQ